MKYEQKNRFGNKQIDRILIRHKKLILHRKQTKENEVDTTFFFTYKLLMISPKIILESCREKCSITKKITTISIMQQKLSKKFRIKERNKKDIIFIVEFLFLIKNNK